MAHGTVTEATRNELVAFVLPGLLHSLGNALFTIRGHAEMLGSGSELGRDRGAIVKASDKAERALTMVRLLRGDERYDEVLQVGVALPRLLELLRVPMRERGVTLRFEHTSTEAPVSVDGSVLCPAVVEVVRRLADELPSAFAGRLLVTLASQTRQAVQLAMRLQAAPASLPFPIGVAAALARAEPVLGALAVDGEPVDHGVVLRLPAARW